MYFHLHFRLMNYTQFHRLYYIRLNVQYPTKEKFLPQCLKRNENKQMDTAAFDPQVIKRLNSLFIFQRSLTLAAEVVIYLSFVMISANLLK